MDLGLKGRTAIVAASSQGLGRATARTLSMEGANVVINGRRLGVLKETKNDIEEESQNPVLAVQGDVTKKEDLNRLVDSTVDEFGGVDILVTNSGPPGKGDLLELNEDSWKKGFRLTVESVIRLTKLVLPYMEQQNWGRIISISSTSLKQPIEGLYVSSVVRMPLLGFFKILSNKYAEAGITFNITCPGPFMTEGEKEMFKRMAEEQDITFEEAKENFIEGDVPMKRLGKPDELGDLIAFLASEKSAYITGTVTEIDGGRVQSFI